MKQKDEKLNWEDYKKMEFTQNVREFLFLLLLYDVLFFFFFFFPDPLVSSHFLFSKDMIL